MDIFYSLELLGTLAFAISGAWVAICKKLNHFGAFIVAFVIIVRFVTFKFKLSLPTFYQNQ